jgi:hypothetical protein
VGPDVGVVAMRVEEGRILVCGEGEDWLDVWLDGQEAACGTGDRVGMVGGLRSRVLVRHCLDR